MFFKFLGMDGSAKVGRNPWRKILRRLAVFMLLDDWRQCMKFCMYRNTSWDVWSLELMERIRGGEEDATGTLGCWSGDVAVQLPVSLEGRILWSDALLRIYRSDGLSFSFSFSFSLSFQQYNTKYMYVNTMWSYCPVTCADRALRRFFFSCAVTYRSSTYIPYRMRHGW